MANKVLRTASIFCLAIWLAIWLGFLLMRFSRFDMRSIPGIGSIMLVTIGIALVAPILAAGLAGVALVRQYRHLDLLILGCALAAFLGQVLLFLITRWL
jgi:hypothetical protein